MSKISLGDIFEIDTPKGKAYLHYIYNDSVIGELVRVLQGLYPEKPGDLSTLASSKERYFIFFPLSAAYNKNIVKHVGNYPVSSFSKPKTMRTEHNIRGNFLGWHLVDTQSWKRQLVNTLTDEQKKFSPWGVWNDTLLIENLVNDWSLGKWG